MTSVLYVFSSSIGFWDHLFFPDEPQTSPSEDPSWDSLAQKARDFANQIDLPNLEFYRIPPNSLLPFLFSAAPSWLYPYPAIAFPPPGNGKEEEALSSIQKEICHLKIETSYWVWVANLILTVVFYLFFSWISFWPQTALWFVTSFAIEKIIDVMQEPKISQLQAQSA